MAETVHRLLTLSDLELRAAGDGEPEVITAVITDESVDRYGDVVVAAGLDVARYRQNPIVLFGHDSKQPIGRARKIWRDGARWLAEFTLSEIPKAREVAQLIREKILRAVSIGFLPKGKAEVRRDDEGNWLGLMFPKTELLEFSVVSVPANANALIQRAIPGAASGPSSTASARQRQTQKESRTMPVGQDIKNLKAALETARNKAEAIYNLAQSEERALNDEEQRDFDQATGEVEELEKRLKAAEDLERVLQSRAAGQPQPPRNQIPGIGHNGGPSLITPPTDAKPRMKGLEFVRLVQCVVHGEGIGPTAIEMAKQFRGDTPDVERLLKAAHEFKTRAAVAPGTTTDATWAGPLMPAAQRIGGEIIELLANQAIVTRLNLRRVPFRTAIPRVTAGATAQWVGEGKLKPVSKGALDLVSVDWNKIAVIAVLTKELLRWGNPDAELLARDLLVQAIVDRYDAKFISADAAAAGISPAGMLNGVTAVPSTGMSVAEITADVQTIMGNFIAAKLSINQVAAVMNPFLRLILSNIRAGTANDTYAFPELRLPEGQRTFFGARVIESEAVALSAVPVQTSIIFVHEPSVLLAKDDAVFVDVSTQASVEMSDNPEGEAGTVVSLWQSNMVGILTEQYITWAKARPAAVQVLTGLEAGPQA